MRAPPANGRRSAERYVAVWLVCFGLLPESCRSRLPRAPVWAASRALSAGSPAESNTPTSCVPSPGPIQTPARPTVDFCPRLNPPAVYAHISPLGTYLRCPTISALGSTEPNQLRYPRRPRYLVKQESGGLLLLRRITPRFRGVMRSIFTL